MKIVFFSWAFLFISFVAAYGTNAYKFWQCDFESNWKCEFIHGVGIFPPASYVTVWFGTDK